MIQRACILAFLVLFAIPCVAFAARGVVVYKKSGCDYYIVETRAGYALLEWYGGNDPSAGDVLVGDFESYGMKKIFNLTQDRDTKVWVEDYWLTKERVVDEYIEHCD